MRVPGRRRSTSRSLPHGLGRGCLPADHDLAFSRARSDRAAGRRRGAGDSRRAVGLPARLRRKPPARRRARSASTLPPNELTANRLPDLDLLATSPPPACTAIAAVVTGTRAEPPPAAELGNVDSTRWKRSRARAARLPALAAAPGARLRASPIRPSTATVIVIGDGGDFVSDVAADINLNPQAGSPDGPGAVRLPRAGLGQAIGVSSPTSTAQVCLLLGMGPSASAGWSSTRWRATASASSARGKNGIWGSSTTR